jgi:hypothetical protein
MTDRWDEEARRVFAEAWRASNRADEPTPHPTLIARFAAALREAYAEGARHIIALMAKEFRSRGHLGHAPDQIVGEDDARREAWDEAADDMEALAPIYAAPAQPAAPATLPAQLRAEALRHARARSRDVPRWDGAAADRRGDGAPVPDRRHVARGRTRMRRGRLPPRPRHGRIRRGPTRADGNGLGIVVAPRPRLDRAGRDGAPRRLRRERERRGVQVCEVWLVPARVSVLRWGSMPRLRVHERERAVIDLDEYERQANDGEMSIRQIVELIDEARTLRELNEHATRERERMAREIERLSANGRMIVSLLRRIVTYAREDRMRTPGVTRLARAIAEAERLIKDEPDCDGSGRAR